MDTYVRFEKIGGGSFGTVYKAQNKKTGEFVAMKRIRWENEDYGIPSSVLREISILKELHHPNIVKLMDVLRVKEGVYLIFELLAMDMSQFIKQLPANGNLDAQFVKSCLFQINEAMLYCHLRFVIHRDLKTANLLITKNGTVKVADFGLCRSIDQTSRVYSPCVMTLWYRAPEVLLRSPLYSCSVDIWSMGCIFAEMIRTQPLFMGATEIDQLLKMFRVLTTPNEATWPGISRMPDYKPDFPIWSEYTLSVHVTNVSDDAFNLLQNMLVYNPSKRISAMKIACHPYFDDLDKSRGGCLCLANLY